ncbi:hypothetical protein CLV79_11552 [Limimaricola soesokkakensis]|uniref:Uncharacterized protein n=1 Tax=Limimaricola soesokkakensis TaxID=1343159 RepID=A0A1X7A140_9RHOB|nr:hypothetical protein [Limimaricola soesokkakensis]PSK81584.1 hypothetical protein CLV79_11552 [Limimaricola soesokkakensis]SLN67518.1 hypothetical protein LOS8367_03375 [Limimaricola soesokkakensis]
MAVKVDMNRLEALLADYKLTFEQVGSIRRKVSQAGFGFDDPFALEIAMREISRYDSAADHRQLRQAASEIHKSAREAVQWEISSGLSLLQRHNETLASRFAGEAERHLTAIMDRVQGRLLWASAAWIALGMAVMLGLGGATGFYLREATGGALPERIAARPDLEAWSELIAENGDMGVLLDTYCQADSAASTLKLDAEGRAFCWLPLRPR